MKFSRYRVLSEVGRGRMGTVYLGQDHLDRLVAIKTLSSALSLNSRFRMQFEREAKIIAKLEHPFIVPVYDYGEENGMLYMVMRYMSGGTLLQWACGKPRSLTEVVPIVERLANALDAAHQQGIVHRDLNPANVLLDAYGQAFLADFGVALFTGQDSSTQVEIAGTPEYMSPEQAAGRTGLDGRADIYALGVTAYQLLSGKLPFSADTPMGVLRQHRQRPPPLLDVVKLGLPMECNTVLSGALAKRPEARHATAQEFAQSLAALRAAPHPIPVRAPDVHGPGPWRVFRRSAKPKSFQTIHSWGDLVRLTPAYRQRKQAWMLATVVALPLIIVWAWQVLIGI